MQILIAIMQGPLGGKKSQGRCNCSNRWKLFVIDSCPLNQSLSQGSKGAIPVVSLLNSHHLHIVVNFIIIQYPYGCWNVPMKIIELDP